tara:strand:- start:899 stop:1171 length:273 start_codon:yes stop_codon:yes gene_type:complete
MNKEVKTSDIIWASGEYLLIPFPDWGDDFEEWDVDKVIDHIGNSKIEGLEAVESKEIARMILTTAVSFRLEVRKEAQSILAELSAVLNSV